MSDRAKGSRMEYFRVFVKGFEPLPPEEALLEYFKKYGGAVSVARETFTAVVDFSSLSERDAAIRCRFQDLCGVKMRVAKYREPLPKEYPNTPQNDQNGQSPGLKRKRGQDEESPSTSHDDWRNAASPDAKRKRFNVKNKLPEDVMRVLGSGDDFETQVKRFIEIIRLPDEGYRLRLSLCDEIGNYLKMFIPGCSTEAFGSTRTGLGLKDSDLDLFLHVPDEFFVDHSGTSQNRRKRPFLPAGGKDNKIVFHRVKEALRKNPQLADIEAIPQARVPVIKFIHVPTGIHCDIQSTSSLGIRNSVLLKTLINSDKRAIQLVYIIRYWAKQLSLTGGSDRALALSNYALCLLILFYLAMKGVLPSVYFLQNEVGPADRCYDNDWDVSISLQTEFVSENVSSVEYLLRDFFVFYSVEFDTDKYVVSPRDGRPIERQRFANLDLPDSQIQYARRRDVHRCKKLNIDCDLVVQDPFELELNVTGSFSARSLQKFKSCCSTAAKLLDACDKLRNLFDVKNYAIETKRGQKWKTKSRLGGKERQKASHEQPSTSASHDQPSTSASAKNVE